MRAKRAKRSRKRLSFRSVRAAGVVALCLSFVSGCSLLGGMPQGDRTEPEPVRSVRTEPVAKRPIEEPVAVVGEVFSSVQADVVASTGGRAERVLKRLGDAVGAGEAIAVLSSEEAQRAKAQAEEALDRARDAVAAARREAESDRREQAGELARLELELERVRRERNKTHNDYDVGLASREALDEAERRVEALETEIRLARQRLQSMGASDAAADAEAQVRDAELALARSEDAIAGLVVTAPIAGIVTELTVVEGTTVGQGEAIGRIDNVDALDVVAFVSEEAAELARSKRELAFSLPGDATAYRAPVRYVAGLLDPEKQAYELRLEAANADGKVKPGAKVSVLLTEEADIVALAVPRHSVVTEGDASFVFVLEGDRAVKRSVALGRSNAYYYEVLSGVAEGERVVVTGQTGLSDGERVVAAEPTAPAAQTGNEGNAPRDEGEGSS